MNKKTITDYLTLPLRIHSLLNGIPLHSLDYVNLPGGKPGMSILDIHDAIGFDRLQEYKYGPITNFLFWLRGQIGRLFAWDNANQLVEENSYLTRISESEKASSLVVPGTQKGINRILYCFQNEMVFEIINKTVHCFWVLASRPLEGEGYDLYVAVYVKRLNWRTPIYMAGISPMLKWIVYPSVLKSIRESWGKYPFDKIAEGQKKAG